MEELIKTQVNENEEIIVSGRELHKFLEVKTPYVKWFNRMIEYGFEKNVDFIVTDIFVSNSKGGRQTQIDHHLKLDMAKEVSMIQRTDKGKQARQYFIKKEKQYWEQLEENKRLAQDNTELHRIAVSDDEQKERQYQADKKRYGWQNIRTVLENCDYRTIEDEVVKIIDFHTNTLKKRDRANYPSHKEANDTEYKQLVRDRVFEVLDDITNTTLDGVLRAVTSELRVNVIKDKLETTNRSNARLQSNLERQYEAVKPPAFDNFHVINYHPFSINFSYEAKINDNGEPYLTDTPAFQKWKRDFPYGFTMPSRKDLNVDFNKPIRIHFYYDHMEKFDRSNFDKSAQDMIFNYYQADDQMVWETGVSRTNKHVDSYDEGKIYFYLENI